MTRFPRMFRFFSFFVFSLMCLSSSVAFATEEATGIDISGFQIDLGPVNTLMAVILTALGGIWVCKRIISFANR